jgi:hypothetical protein
VSRRRCAPPTNDVLSHSGTTSSECSERKRLKSDARRDRLDRHHAQLAVEREHNRKSKEDTSFPAVLRWGTVFHIRRDIVVLVVVF